MKSKKEKTLLIWVFTDKEDVSPRYDQKSFDIENQINTFVNIVSPKDKNNGNTSWVYQQTFFLFRNIRKKIQLQRIP